MYDCEEGALGLAFGLGMLAVFGLIIAILCWA